MKIKVTITTWQVPFDQVVEEVQEFSDPELARRFINLKSWQWWVANEGERYTANHPGDPAAEYEPVTELGYNHARYELWGGEVGFHAMLDKEAWFHLHNEHYKREYDDKGIKRPGYLRNAYGEDTSAEIEELFARSKPLN